VRKRSIVLVALSVAAVLAVAAHRWAALGWNAWRYPEAPPSDRTQIAIAGHRGYIAAGVDGIEVVDLSSGTTLSLLPPAAPADRVDDLATIGGWLFALDATIPGHLLVYSLANPDRPALASRVAPTEVGPFSGVSAAPGVVAVSGGTSQLSLREFDSNGQLTAMESKADFGRGQPDIALRADGRMAAISTHSFGPNFSVTLAAIQRVPLALQAVGHVDLPEAGFTQGGYKPSHFPLNCAWVGDRLYVAHGGGLTVVNAVDPTHPKVLVEDRQAAPAMDIAIASHTLDVLRAGEHSAILRYRLDPVALPVLQAIYPLPSADQPNAIASDENLTLVTLRRKGLKVLAPTDFSPIPSS
jgi:hypothetical protein